MTPSDSTCGRGCDKPGKAPHYRLCPSGSKQATTDKAEIQRWFDSGEKFNIGICAGKESNLVIVDVDPQHGGVEAFAELTKGKVPQTPTVETGSGGSHYYFAHPVSDIRNSAGTVGAGIDVRGHNGYVVAPPSMHTCGKEYRWTIDPQAGLADLPKWVVAAKTAPESTDTGAKRVGYIIPEGRRDNELTRIAGGMRRTGSTPDEIYERLVKVNSKRCRPPLDDKDLCRISQSIGRYQPEQKKAEDRYIILENDDPDTVARAFRKWSVEHCGVVHRYNRFDGWSIYHNEKYQRVEDEAEIQGYLRTFIANEIRIKTRKKNDEGEMEEVIVRPDKRQKSRANIENILLWFRDMHGVKLMPSQKSPCSFNKELDPEYTIAVNNGLLDWSVWPPRLVQPTPEYYTLNYLPFDWNGDISSDMWDSYLYETTCGDEEVMLLLQQWAGYCLMKNKQVQQKFMIIYGPAGTGKSVFADVLVHLLGMANISTVPLSMFTELHIITQAYGKMLNICDESESTLVNPEYENALKKYTGGTPFTFKHFYKPPISDYPTAKVMITTNNRPPFKDTSDGVWRRVLMVEFTNVPQTIIPGLSDIIAETEMSGVLSWALKGIKSLQEMGGFNVPASSQKALEEYKNEVHPERQFLTDNFEETENETLFPLCKSVRKIYELYANENNFGIKNEINFGKSLKSIFKTSKRLRIRKGGTRVYVYTNIAIKTDSEYFEIFMKLEVL